MIRVLHIVGSMNRAGAETMLMNLYRNIDRTKIQFDFLYFTELHSDYDHEILALGGKIYRLPFTSQQRSCFCKLWKLLGFFKGKSYKIVHSHLLLNNSFQLLVAMFCNIPIRISHSHSSSSNKKPTLINKIYEKLARKVIKRVSTFNFACNSSAAKYLYPKSLNVYILPNSVDVAQLSNFKRDLSRSEEISILQVGRLEEVKNFMYSILIAKRLKELGVNFNMSFVGTGTLEQDLKDMVCKYKLSQVIKFLGTRSDVGALMGKSDVLIMPSLFEGLPVTLVEAQSVGIPSIISNKISRDVDLGVGLISFIGIEPENINMWADKIIASKKHNVMSRRLRIDKIKSNGFDVAENAKKISVFYISEYKKVMANFNTKK